MKQKNCICQGCKKDDCLCAGGEKADGRCECDGENNCAQSGCSYVLKHRGETRTEERDDG